MDSKAKELISKYEVTAIPALVVLNANLQTITTNAKKGLILNGVQEIENWRQKNKNLSIE